MESLLPQPPRSKESGLGEIKKRNHARRWSCYKKKNLENEQSRESMPKEHRSAPRPCFYPKIGKELLGKYGSASGHACGHAVYWKNSQTLENKLHDRAKGRKPVLLEAHAEAQTCSLPMPPPF